MDKNMNTNESLTNEGLIAEQLKRPVTTEDVVNQLLELDLSEAELQSLRTHLEGLCLQRDRSKWDINPPGNQI
jgi:hypothetical protein